MNQNWISIKEKQPEPDTSVLGCLDYSKWGRKEQRILIVDVHYSEIPIKYGGPSSLTGYGFTKGLYYSLPAIINPEVLTHWMPLPDKPNV